MSSATADASRFSSEEDRDDICQICFIPNSCLLMTPCQHCACRSCFERLLLYTEADTQHHHHESDHRRRHLRHQRGEQQRQQNNENWSELQEDDIIEACPTRGRCPFCRRSVDMFQLKEKNHHPSSGSTSTTEQMQMAYRKGIKIEEGPLCGLTFFDTKRAIGDHSFHFPSSDSTTTADGTEAHHDHSTTTTDGLPIDSTNRNSRPFINFIDCCARDERLDNGDPIPERKIFQPEFDYHETSRTFRGTIDWTEGEGGSTFKGSHQWEVIMQFSSDFERISKGGIIKHRPPPNTSPTTTPAYRTPLDGWWEVIYRRTRRERISAVNDDGDVEYYDDNDTHQERVQVVNNSFYRSSSSSSSGDRFVIDLGVGAGGKQRQPPGCTWPGMRKPDGGSYSQVVESGVDLQRQIDGPDVGDVIVWTTDHPDYHRILWIRETKNNCITVERFGLEYRDSINYIRKTGISLAKPKYNMESLWGNVFIQGFRVGYASYHFVSSEREADNGAYISYEHWSCAAWPLLDNGSPLPSRVPFVRQSFDEETRTFCGTIAWMEVYSTCWQGDKSWQYEIIFDTEFTCITAGKIVAETQHGTEGGTHTFGHDLNYINAAMVEKIKLEADMMVQNEDDGNHLGHINSNSSTVKVMAVVNVNRGITNRLQEEGVSIRTLAEVQSVAHGILEGRDSIDYLI